MTENEERSWEAMAKTIDEIQKSLKDINSDIKTATHELYTARVYYDQCERRVTCAIDIAMERNQHYIADAIRAAGIPWYRRLVRSLRNSERGVL